MRPDPRPVTCRCGRFSVPWCCGRYLEDAQGRRIHTESVCYVQGEGDALEIIEPARSLPSDPAADTKE